MGTENKQVNYQKIQTMLLAGILVILLLGSILLCTQISRVTACLDIVEKDLQAINMDDINGAVVALTDAANQLAAVDIDTLNGTITSLKDAADTLKGIDIEALNNLVSSLDTVASKLESAVNAITGIFKH